MSSIGIGSSSETEHLGHSAPPAGLPPRATYQTPQKKSGCGCGCGCLSGCLLILLLIAGFFAFLYFFGFKDDRYIGHIDRVVVWTYQGIVRPKLTTQFTAGMPESERTRFLQISDAAVAKYLALSPQDKKAMLHEAAVAFWYLQEGSILPPEKIPNLKKFVDELNAEHKGPLPGRPYSPPPRRFQEPPRRLQEPPRQPLPPPKQSPRLLN